MSTSGKAVGAFDHRGHIVQSDIWLAEVDRFVHLNAMQLSEFRQRLGRFHPISAIADHHLRETATVSIGSSGDRN